MTVRYRGHNISKQDLLQAMQRFRKEYPESNDYQRWLDNRSYTYSVTHKGHLYPPKYLISLITGMKTTEFKHADKIRSVFNQLGFMTPSK
jgi:hypothetical protein